MATQGNGSARLKSRDSAQGSEIGNNNLKMMQNKSNTGHPLRIIRMDFGIEAQACRLREWEWESSDSAI
jgi:hypothetical protein